MYYKNSRNTALDKERIGPIDLIHGGLDTQKMCVKKKGMHWEVRAGIVLCFHFIRPVSFETPRRTLTLILRQWATGASTLRYRHYPRPLNAHAGNSPLE